MALTFLRRIARLFGRGGAASPSSPFIDDPRDMVGRHLASALDSPIVDVAAIHLEQAIHQSAIARESGLLKAGKGRRRRD